MTDSNPEHLLIRAGRGPSPLHRTFTSDTAADDPAAGLYLSDDLVSAFHTWARRIDETLEKELPYQGEDRYADEWQRLFRQGTDLSERLAHELGPARTVTYKGLANGGLAALTSVTWQGDHQVKPR
ncbi:hypothetical protein [Streptomyces sp. NPDC058755]|uniref:hypothetical protein n=1 Tax=Streptomyces sp. NPDC058755 TaxID=3346624 RepID=UPI0036B22BEC